MCRQEQNKHSHLVVVYVLLDKYKAYGPLVVVKGTPRKLCLYGDKEQSIIHEGWSAWELPSKQHWEIPPRNDSDRRKRREQFPTVALEDQGET